MAQQPIDDESPEDRPLISALSPERAFGNYQAAQVELAENRAKLSAAQSALQSLRERFSNLETKVDALEGANKSLARLNNELSSKLLSSEHKEQERSALIEFLKGEATRLTAEKEQQFQQLQGLLMEKERALDAVASSTAFRIGKKITGFAKKLLNIKAKFSR